MYVSPNLMGGLDFKNLQFSFYFFFWLIQFKIYYLKVKYFLYKAPNSN